MAVANILLVFLRWHPRPGNACTSQHVTDRLYLHIYPDLGRFYTTTLVGGWIFEKYFGEFLRWKIDIREEHWMSNKSIMWSIAEKVNVKKINNATNHPLFHKIKHRKNCECCPLPRLIVRSQWFRFWIVRIVINVSKTSWIQFAKY